MKFISSSFFMQAPQIVRGNLSEMTSEQLQAIGQQMYDRLTAQRARYFLPKIQSIDIHADDISGLSDAEIAIRAEYDYYKYRTKPGSEVQFPEITEAEKAFTKVESERIQSHLDWSKGKSIVSLEKMKRQNQGIRRVIITKEIEDKIRGKYEPLQSSICFSQSIPEIDMYYFCRFVAYGKQSTVFHILFSKEFITKYFMLSNRWSLLYPLGKLVLFQKQFFDREYVRKNKRKIFKHHEYFLVFSIGGEKEQNSCLDQLRSYLGISRVGLNGYKNFFSFCDPSASLKTVFGYHLGFFDRFMNWLNFFSRE